MHATLGILPQETARAVFAPLLATIAVPPAFLGALTWSVGFAGQPRAPPILIWSTDTPLAPPSGIGAVFSFPSDRGFIMSNKASRASARALIAAAALASTSIVLPAMAEDSLVTILAPADGATLAAKQTAKLDYEVQPSVKADHVHLFVDGDEVGMAHKLKGSFKLGPLKAGSRKVCVSPVNKNHTPIGKQACITVTVQ
jgi:hypothetical protein